MIRWILLGLFAITATTASAQCITCRPAFVPVIPLPPPVIYQPQVQIQYTPLQYRGSAFVERRYPTPFRDRWFGRGTVYNYYSPVQQKVQPNAK